MTNIVCKVCLMENVKMQSFNSSQLKELYEKILNQKLHYDTQTDTICYICFALLNKCYKFVKMAQESNRILSEHTNIHINNSINKNRPVTLSLTKTSHHIISDALMPISKVEIKMEPNIDSDQKWTEQSSYLEDNKIDDLSDNDSTRNDLMIINDNDIKENVSSDDEPLINYVENNAFDAKVKKKRHGKRLKCDDTQKKLKNKPKPIEIYIPKDHEIKQEADNMKLNTGPKKTCHICSREISKVGFKTHLRIHAGDKSYSCNLCNYKCVRKYSLDVHYRVHSGQKPFSCHQCEYRSSIKKNLQRHLLVHSGIRPFACEVCGQTFTQKVTLESHILRKHSNEKPYPCDVCGHRFVRKQELKKHKLVHTQGRRPRKCINTKQNLDQYLCHVCDYVCKQKSALKTHLLTHSGEKPYRCEVCEFKTNSKPTLKTHMRRHTGEKPYLCHYCDYRCAQRSNLNNHIKIHTGVKNYACDLCEYRSTQLPHLKQHRKIHTGEKSFICLLCNYKCSYKQRLQKHIMGVHRREGKQE